MDIRLIVLSIMICSGGCLWAVEGRSAFSVCDMPTDVVADTSKSDMRTRFFYITQDIVRKHKCDTHAWLFWYDNKTLAWTYSDVKYVAVGKPLGPREQCAVDIACGNYIFSLWRMKDGTVCAGLSETQLLVLETQRRCARNLKGKCLAVMNIVSIPTFILHDLAAYRHKLHVASWLACYGEDIPKSIAPLRREYEKYVGNTIEHFWTEVLTKQFTSEEDSSSKLFRPFELDSSVVPKIVPRDVLG